MDKLADLRAVMDEFVDAWDSFLMDEINTATLTDHVIDLMRAIDDITGIKDPRTPSEDE
ncbi:MAG: hypothetical protein Unbinned1446contig1001_33 [Prokaryotic dsDNA virus sp.]|nr:MAG: hypothetical protein Unbinned1446contig1001_33 [Prokaryotic dsDNA virus sp.]